MGRASATFYIAVLVLCLAAFFVFGCSGPGYVQEQQAEAPADDPPNILFVLTDDLDYTSAQKMPNLRSLMIEEGASFDNAFTSQ